VQPAAHEAEEGSAKGRKENRRRCCSRTRSAIRIKTFFYNYTTLMWMAEDIENLKVDLERIRTLMEEKSCLEREGIPEETADQR
jgi:hypothetical protein